MAVATLQKVESLRRHLNSLAPFQSLKREPTGVQAFDEAVGGLPKGTLTAFCGERGDGHLRLAARIAAAFTQGTQPVAWIDGEGTLYPPALFQLGVQLERLLIVQNTDAIEQVLKSGVFPLVIVSGLSRLSTRRVHRLRTAAENSGSMGLLLTSDKSREFLSSMSLVLRVQPKSNGWRVEVQRGGGRAFKLSA